jgi:uncharacterized membrane protein
MTLASLLERLLPSLVVAGAVGAGLMAGLLFAFSNFVMKALTQMPAAHGMEAMQRINVEIVNPFFLLLFMGTAVVSLALIVGAFTSSGMPARTWLVVGAACYLVGVIGITAAFNVPLNNSIASLPATAAESSWPDYVAAWLRWNHLRTVFAVIASVSLVVAALELGSGPTT